MHLRLWMGSLNRGPLWPPKNAHSRLYASLALLHGQRCKRLEDGLGLSSPLRPLRVTFSTVTTAKVHPHSKEDPHRDEASLRSIEACLRSIEACLRSLDVPRLETLLEEYQARDPQGHNAHIYLAVIRCYMAASRPQQAVHFFQTQITRGFKPTLEILEHLIGGLLRHSEEDKAQSIMNSLSLYNLQPRTTTYNIWIRYYLRGQQPEKARGLFRKIESDGLRPNSLTFQHFVSFFIDNADFSAAEKIREYMRRQGIILRVSFYNALLESLLRKTAYQEVQTLLEEMKEANISFDMRTYNILIKAYAAINDHDRVCRLMAQMREQGLRPTTDTFNKLLSSYSKAMSPEQSREILLQMNDLGLQFNGETYAALVKNLIFQEKYRESIELLYEMERRNVVLTVEAYGRLLKHCCDGRIDPAVTLLRLQMQKYQIPPNHHVFATLIRYYLLRRKYAIVDGLFLEMQRKWNIKANPYIFCILLNHYVEHMDFARIRDVLEVVRKSGVEVNPVMYNVLMKSFYAYSRYQQGGHLVRLKGPKDGLDGGEGEGEGDLLEENSLIIQIPPNDLAFSTEIDTDLPSIPKLKLGFEKLFGLPFKPTVHLFNDIMLAFFIRERFEEVFSCLNEMRRNGILPNLLTYTLLIKAQIFQGSLGPARELIMEMGKLGLRPTLLQCALLLHALCRRLMTADAESFMQDMVSMLHLRPNHVFYASLIYAYIRKREYSNVFVTFERMEKAGFLPDTETCNYVLIALLEIGEFSEAKRFFEKMILQGIKRNTHTYAYLADAYLQRQETTSLLDLLGDCMGEGNVINAYPFNRLLEFYYRRGEVAQFGDILTKMLEYSVRFDSETLPFIMLTCKHLQDDLERLPFLRKLLEKALVDLEVDPMGQIAGMFETFKSIYTASGQVEELKSLEEYLANLEPLRTLMTCVSPSLQAFHHHHHYHLPSDCDLAKDLPISELQTACDHLYKSVGRIISEEEQGEREGKGDNAKSKDVESDAESETREIPTVPSESHKLEGRFMV